MNTLLKAHSSAWLDSKAYRLAWLMGPLAIATLVFGSGFWVTPGNNLRVMQVPLSYTQEENERIAAGLKVNDPATLQELRAAADDNDLRALNYMGLLYDPTKKGLSAISPNLDVALAYFDRAAELGSIKALMNAGFMLSSSGKPDQACNYFEKAFDAAPIHDDAKAHAGYCMATEKDAVAAEKAKGIGLMESAGASGVVRAYGLLGITYMLQTPPDVKQAVANFDKAVAGNIDDSGYAHHQLGSIYFTGKTGVPQDLKKAREHFQKGFEQGSADSAVDLSLIYSSGNHGAAVDAKKAMEYAAFAAKEGHSVGHYNLFIHYVYGAQGVRKDYDVAAKHLLNAISLGYKTALDNLKSSGNLPREFIFALQSKLSQAVLYNGPINGQLNPALHRSLESLLNNKRMFE